MQIEQSPPNHPRFILVVYMAVGAVVVIVLAAIIVISWRNHKPYKPPYAKHPVSQIRADPGRGLRA